ncbi:MAG: Bro-N domain-containing protein [Anaerovoracaceae bacterium]
MNELKIFENQEFGRIRVVKQNGEPWFVGKDVAGALGYSNTKDAISSHIDAEDKRIIQRSEIATVENHIPKSAFPINFVSGDIPNRGLTIINESGLYSLILSGKLPTAKSSNAG